MIDLRALFLENPELRRNLRIELRPKRLLTAGLITAIFALVVLPSVLPANRPGDFYRGAGAINSYLLVVLWTQRITLTLGGAISCWRAVRRERELNTYDFQRVTRLSPLELAVGKLLGAPALAYFVTLLLVPPALYSALTSTSPEAVPLLFRSYVLLFTGSLVVHSFALMISTVSDKGGTASGVTILLLLQIFPALGWLLAMSGAYSAQSPGAAPGLRFYGIAFPMTTLWANLELGFAAWFLLAVVRNIKSDLDAMQLFTPRQGLGFALYCNFVWIGFYPWTSAASGSSSLGALLFLSVVFFYLVGIGVLQSREGARRGMRESAAAGPTTVALLGPLAFLLGGALLAGIVVVILAEAHPAGNAALRLPYDLFLLLYFTAWLARDLFYLQWMRVRAVRSPLRKAFLYLAVFYISTSIVFRSALISAPASTAAFAAWLGPFPLLREWTNVQWDAASQMWLGALVGQAAAAAFFAYLYRQEILGLRRRPVAAPPASPTRLSSTPA